MTFLDEQGVGPCGHAAKDKKILLNVVASCLSHQIPRKLAYSVRGIKNDTGTKEILSYHMTITDAQDARRANFTNIRCGQESIDNECLCLPRATWKMWNKSERIRTVWGVDKGMKVWHILLLPDEVEATEQFHRALASGHKDYGETLESGLGEGPSEELVRSIREKYGCEVYQKKVSSTQQHTC